MPAEGVETRAAAWPDDAVAVPEMTLANTIGGFTDEGRAYTIVLEGAQETPLPWANVIANPHFGTIVTSAGASRTRGR